MTQFWLKRGPRPRRSRGNGWRLRDWLRSRGWQKRPLRRREPGWRRRRPIERQLRKLGRRRKDWLRFKEKQTSRLRLLRRKMQRNRGSLKKSRTDKTL